MLHVSVECHSLLLIWSIMVLMGECFCLHKEFTATMTPLQGRGYDHPVKPVNNRGLTGAKV